MSPGPGGHANGRPDARVLFLAEAPGRLGGDRTGVPLTSDQTGRNFARGVDRIGKKIGSHDDLYVYWDGRLP